MDDFRELVLLLTPLYGEGEAHSLASIVFEDVFGRKRAAREALQPEERVRLQPIAARLAAGEPLQYVLGEADFFGMKLRVGPDVLIPRQETEELVAWAIAHLRNLKNDRPRVLDIGTGSGCIALAIQKQFTSAEVMALDVSESALDVARQNARLLGLPVQCRQGDILSPDGWPDGSFDLIISNPPYVLPSEAVHMPVWVKAHEPGLALFVPENDPLLFYRVLCERAPACLSPEGALLVEVSAFHARQVTELFEKAPFRTVLCKNDLSGMPRMVGGFV
ncbi:MAG: peptide chain release factor N(5)-glutamine methyltransferase [Saprospiraceae bacterium]|nr:peptide chain release factor N(5)-glutamine methyltransferase [Saprospiraceae bacterium]